MRHIKILILLMLTTLILYGCGGGTGGVDGTGQNPVYLEGTAAVGSPISNIAITVKGKAGKKIETTTDDNGKYKVDVQNLEAPYLLHTITENNISLFSIAFKAGITNIHPLTDLVSRNFYAGKNSRIDDEFDGDTTFNIVPGSEEIGEISNAVKNMFAAAYAENTIANDFDFLTSYFDANQIAFDALLDQTQIIFINNSVSIKIVDKTTNISANVVVNLNINFDLTADDSEKPTPPTAITPISASDNTIVTVWNSATDNVAVSGYRVFRAGNDEAVAIVSAPVFSDTNLNVSTEYCYSVEAFDGQGNTSVRSAESCATTLAQKDSESPEKIINIVPEAKSGSQINITWKPSAENDVLGYHVYQKNGDIWDKISTVIASSYIVDDLVENTEYCFQIQAFDAALNQSPLEETACETTFIVDTTAPITAASIVGSTYTSVQTIQLLCNDGSGSGCKSTYYTLDGSTPTTQSSLYVNGILMESSAELKFFSIDRNGNSEAIQTEIYTLILADVGDIAAPTTTANITGGLLLYSRSVELTCDDGTGSGCDATYFTTNGDEPTILSDKYVNPFEVTINTTLRFFSKDVAGNSEGTRTEIIIFEVDVPAASINISGGFFNTAQTITLSCNDNGSGCDKVYYTIDGSEPNTTSLSYSRHWSAH